VFSACDGIQLLSVELCGVRTVHKFGLTLVINETTSKKRPVERSCSDRDSCFWYELHVFHRPPSRELRSSTHPVEVNRILLSNGQHNIYEIKLITNKIPFPERRRTTTGTWSERPAITGSSTRHHSYSCDAPSLFRVNKKWNTNSNHSSSNPAPCK